MIPQGNDPKRAATLNRATKSERWALATIAWQLLASLSGCQRPRITPRTRSRAEYAYIATADGCRSAPECGSHFPFVIKLPPFNNHDIYCSGVVLEGNRVLTAAHCVCHRRCTREHPIAETFACCDGADRSSGHCEVSVDRRFCLTGDRGRPEFRGLDLAIVQYPPSLPLPHPVTAHTTITIRDARNARGVIVGVGRDQPDNTGEFGTCRWGRVTTVTEVDAGVYASTSADCDAFPMSGDSGGLLLVPVEVGSGNTFRIAGIHSSRLISNDHTAQYYDPWPFVRELGGQI